ncbi:capsular polysaccharide synthesis protein [Oenococcus oeni]|uniref:capsular polysaccharide synthesis protein n=1 Tax=Oenococcus oeni TaxID=1247 RepID=UPI00067AF0C5|nr:capsular polysaccharide synthesis protein [Oenococcus oeni]OIM54911.1 hypothetical protein ATX80_07165 [Oenococcus oeni]
MNDKRILSLLKKKSFFKEMRVLYRSHVLFYSIAIFPFLSYSNKSLEVYRDAIENLIHSKLEKRYSRRKIDFESSFIGSNGFKNTNEERPVWVMWLQGYEAAPSLVRFNINRLKNVFGDSRIHIITKKNMLQYVSLPVYIYDKWLSGIITNTHFSDLIRVCLLSQYGGIWIDATVFWYSSSSLSYLENDDVFFLQTLKAGGGGNATPVSSWLMASTRSNALISRVRELLFIYWRENNILIDYFLFHHFLVMAMAEYPSITEGMTRISNAQAQDLQEEMSQHLLSERKYFRIMNNFPFHKLTNKGNDIFKQNLSLFFNLNVERYK